MVLHCAKEDKASTACAQGQSVCGIDPPVIVTFARRGCLLALLLAPADAVLDSAQRCALPPFTAMRHSSTLGTARLTGGVGLGAERYHAHSLLTLRQEPALRVLRVTAVDAKLTLAAFSGLALLLVRLAQLYLHTTR